jgi:hypothetical protein
MCKVMHSKTLVSNGGGCRLHRHAGQTTEHPPQVEEAEKTLSHRAAAHVAVVSGVAGALHQEAHDLYLAVSIEGDLRSLSVDRHRRREVLIALVQF